MIEMFESLLSNFLQGIFFGVIFSFIEVLLGRRRFYIIIALTVSAYLFLGLASEGLTFGTSFFYAFFRLETLSFIIGLIPGNWIGEQLGKQWKMK